MDDHFDTSGVFEISKFDISKFACIYDPVETDLHVTILIQIYMIYAPQVV